MIFSPAICHINLNAIKNNFKMLGKPDALMPVIKSDAYGHGLLQVAKALDEAGAKYFAVGTVDEGLALRAQGLKQVIVPLLGCLGAQQWQDALTHKLMPVAGSFQDLADLGSALSQNGLTDCQIALKCDTGMSRLGFALGELAELLDALNKYPRISPALLISHLACADNPEDEEYTSEQIEIYEKFYSTLQAIYPKIQRSLGNSASVVGMHAAKNDISRPGLALYGGDPFHGTSMATPGQPREWPMSLSAPIIHIRKLKAGQSVSYGRIYTAQCPMRIGIVACGYANGVNRGLSNKLQVLVDGRRTKQLGRICMGMMMVDLSLFPNTKTGDHVWILGGKPDAGHSAPDAQELADLIGTIPYEVMCHVGSLNQRVYDSMQQ